MRWLLGLLVVVGCGDDGHIALDAPPSNVDGPDLDAPDVDGPDIDAPDIDAPGIDAPIDAQAIDGPLPQYCMTNADCLPDRYCPLADRSYCRHRFQPSYCTLRPLSCPAPNPGDRPVCGCDGESYATECDALAAGATMGPGGCADQGSLYACGDTFCERGSEYCAELRYNDDFPSRDWECRPMPSSSDPCVPIMNQTCPGTGHPVPGMVPESCSPGDPGEIYYMCYVRWT